MALAHTSRNAGAVPILPPPSVDELRAAAARFSLQLEGEPFATRACLLCCARYRGEPAVLKMTNEPEERAGPAALRWWNGEGAVRVLLQEGGVAVLERAGETLRQAIAGDDARATSVICDVIDRLHRRGRLEPPPAGFPSLRGWMRSLFHDTHPRFEEARRYAARLLDADREPVLLHGDLHAENILRGGSGEWLAIDPKGVVGPRAFDYCNLFTNWTLDESLANFDARLDRVVQRAEVERSEMLQWIAAWSALSGIWHVEDGDDAEAAYPHAVMDLALMRLAT